MRWLSGWSLHPVTLWRQLTCRHPQWDTWRHASGATKQVCRDCELEHR